MSDVSLYYAFGCVIIGILTIVVFRFNKSAFISGIERIYQIVYFILLMALAFAVGYFRSDEMIHFIWNILLAAFILLIAAAVIGFMMKKCWSDNHLIKNVREKNGQK